ncbi:SDR family NAD(P)-dependent oxidoreductase [Rhodocytophaga aerolata]|uniref:SDR family NAD(P)-dependent oxidoreductase n=2 Tax=Rhodocytophaga aerolata TaxID=455078 RepID=A0ABT8RFF7_9BACT|nr:SDR family NAD(P)-dependent oxidoreductase [Rhodocytophaga aerolata]MDO1450846.1 SDR family NAD(P)-dependent oxidoreductase [Rhodocytophaga aerolata]
MIVVTGTSTGIGHATAQELARRGFHVLAGVRREIDARAMSGTNLEPVMLDITSEFDIAALVTRIGEDPEKRPLRALVNNAAIEINAPVEVLPLSEWRRQFDVNLFGQVAMIQALLPALIKSRGRVVNISSIGGKGAMGVYGPYASTKFALEAVSDALRREMEPFDVKVIVVQPGAVTTPMSTQVRVKAERITSAMTAEQHGRYGELMHAMVSQAESYINKAVSAECAGQIIADAILSKRPRTRYTIGRDAAMLSILFRLLPDRLLDRIIARSLKAHYPSATK